MKRHLYPCMFLGLVLALAAPLRAQPLVDYVPDDAIVYVGWQGTKALGKSFDGSRLAAFMKDLEIERVLDELNIGIAPILREEGAGVFDSLEKLKKLAPILWRSQCAVYARAIPQKDKSDGEIRIIVKADDEIDRAAVKEAFNDAAKDEPGRSRVDMLDGLLIFTHVEHGQADDKSLPSPAGKAERSIKGTAQLAAGLAGAPGAPAAVGYVDVKKAIAVMSEEMIRGKPPAEVLKANAAVHASGVDDVNAVTVAAGFDGRDWFVQTFLDAPAPRRGLVSLADAAAITDQDLLVVPDTATGVTALRLDLPAVFDQARKIAQAVGPEAAGLMDLGLTGAAAVTGVDLEKDLAGSMGPAWIVYTFPDPSIGDIGGGVCLVNVLKDPVKAQASLDKLIEVANNMGGGNMMGPSIRFHALEQGGVKLYTAYLLVVAPTLTIVDGRLYVTLTAEEAVSAAAAARRPEKSIVKSPRYQAAVAAMAGKKPLMIQYLDLEASAGQMYGVMAYYLRFFSTIRTFEGKEPLPLIMPPLEKIVGHLGPATSAAWADAGGVHVLERSPFPGAVFMNPMGFFNLSTAELMTAMIGPAGVISQRRERAEMPLTRARGIHTGQILYAQGNDSKFSDDIAVLIRGSYFTPDYALAPSKALPPGYNEWPADKQDQWIRKNASFILVPGLKDDTDPERIAVFMRPGDAEGDSIPVAFNDNHVVLMKTAEARVIIQKQTGKTIEELITRQENYPQAAAAKPGEPPPAIEPAPVGPAMPPPPPR